MAALGWLLNLGFAGGSAAAPAELDHHVVNSLIDPDGIGVLSAISSTGKGVNSTITNAHAILTILDTDGKGVDSTIDSDGIGVNSKFNE